VHFQNQAFGIGLAFALILLPGCSKKDQPVTVKHDQPESSVTETHLRFDEVQEESGIQFRHFGSRRDSAGPTLTTTVTTIFIWSISPVPF